MSFGSVFTAIRSDIDGPGFECGERAVVANCGLSRVQHWRARARLGSVMPASAPDFRLEEQHVFKCFYFQSLYITTMIKQSI
jgi:hypothetical protein